MRRNWANGPSRLHRVQQGGQGTSSMGSSTRLRDRKFLSKLLLPWAVQTTADIFMYNDAFRTMRLSEHRAGSPRCPSHAGPVDNPRISLWGHCVSSPSPHHTPSCALPFCMVEFQKLEPTFPSLSCGWGNGYKRGSTGWICLLGFLRAEVRCRPIFLLFWLFPAGKQGLRGTRFFCY